MEWRPIAGYEGRYEVSDEGQVHSLLTDRFLKGAPTSKGYLSIVLYDGSSPKRPSSQTIHSLVAAAFIGPRPSGLGINHKDGNKRNNAALNLEYATAAENNRHALDTGLASTAHLAKYRLANRKLTSLQVQQIREIAFLDWRRGVRMRLARSYGVSERAIADILNGVSYQEVEAIDGSPYGPPSSFGPEKIVLVPRKRQSTGGSFLTEDRVQEIRLMASQGIHHEKIAEAFQVGRSTICMIANRRCWKHI